MTHKELTYIGSKWLHKKASNIYYKSQFVVTEFKTAISYEIPDILGIRPQGNVLIEVKTSRSDFKRDLKKKCRNIDKDQIGAFRFYLTTKGLLKEEEIPDGWGLLEYDKETENIEIIKEPIKQNENYEMLCYIYYSIIRRTNKPQVFIF